MTDAPHPWMPVSPCGDDCLPAPGAVPTVGRIRHALRLLAAVVHVLFGLALGVLLPVLPAALRYPALRVWYRGLFAALRIRVEVVGGSRFGPPGAGVLVVSNHVSWLDPLVLGTLAPLRPVAKHDVREWPVIGMLVRGAGTIFVHRERLGALPGTVAEIRAALAAGRTVAVFPEGTSWCGRSGGRFRPATFQAACDAAVPVRPVALRYLVGGRPSTVAAFVGTATLVQSAVRLARVRGLAVHIQLLPLLPTEGADRRTLAAVAGAAVAAATRPAVAVPSVPPQATPSGPRPEAVAPVERAAG